MRVLLDQDKCTGHGVCEALMPDVFEVQDDGTARVLDENPEEGRRGSLLDAVRGCPADAIRVADRPARR